MKVFAIVFAAAFALLTNAYAGDPEFGGQCTMGMAEGRKMQTNCSVLWLGSDDKIYCFADQAAKQKFLQAPKENLKRAQAFWEDPENLKRLIKRE
ncbi:MAG TPA: hypothetical protein VN496_02800 [Burkholderiales bacterium]|nr:hypothetical protein [Burkholderiales bacterium]